MTSRPRIAKTAVLACALVLGVAVPTLATGPAPEASLSRAVPGVAPAVADAAVPVIAWLATEGAAGARRVHGVAWPGVEEGLGPDWPGSDGTPSVAGDGGRAWVAAARRTASGSRLWTRAWRRGRWSPPIAGPGSSGHDHHPAVAVSDRGVWITWVADSPGDPHLEAASWNGSAWTPAERVPGPAVAPTAPAVAIDSRGQPLVVWAAHDGPDAEIWMARRRRDRWSRAVPLTDNDVPDILPAVGVDGQGPLVAWSHFAGTGYVPMAVRVTRRPGPEQPEAVTAIPGGAPSIVGTSRGAVLVWASPRPDPRAHEAPYEIHLAARDRDSWSAPHRLATASSPRFTVAGHGDRVLLGWHDTAGPIAARGNLDDRRGGADGVSLSPLLAAPAPATAPAVPLPRLPSAYTGFGDSITFGTMVTSGVVKSTRGYPGYLSDLLARQFGQSVPVLNRGVPGELTSEGLGRLAGIVTLGGATDFMLLMEGANDISGLVDPVTVSFNLQQMVNLVLGANRMPVLSTITPFFEGGFDGGLNPRIETVNSLIRSFARARGVLLVDNHEVFYRSAHLYSDRIHPNDDGYEVMAETWYEALKPILEALLLRQDNDETQAADESIQIPEHASDTGHQPPGCC